MKISIFNSTSEAYVLDELDGTWEEVVEFLIEHRPAERKEDVAMFNMGEFKKADDPTVELGRRYQYIDGVRQESYDEIPDTVRRCKANLIAIHGLVLDVDSHMTIQQVKEKWHGIEMLIYTTFRHQLDGATEKFRAVIPFSRPLLAEDIEGRRESMKVAFPGVDNASFTASQSFYLHSGNRPELDYVPGVIIDPYDFPYTAPVVYAASTFEYAGEFDEEAQQRYRTSTLASLLSCSGLHYAGTDATNHGILTLVTICRSAKIDFPEFCAICDRIGDPESSVRQSAVQHQAWQSWDGSRITRAKRDLFIAGYGGTVFSATDVMNTIKKEKQNG